MTRALEFPSEEALRVALTTGVVDAELAASPARGWRTAEGAVRAAPDRAPSPVAQDALRAGGVDVIDATVPDGAPRVRCLAELVRARAAPNAPLAERVLFVAPDARTQLELAAELLRLGCDRQELRRAGDLFLLRALGPSYFTVARALDRIGGVRAYGPTPEGQDRVWVELGYAHPLAARLRPEEDEVLLVSEDPWVSLRDGAWTDVYAIADFAVPGAKHALHATEELPRLAVSMRLVRGGADDAATLWVLERDAIAQVERLMASAPDAVAQGLLFAVSDEEPPRVLLRARPSAKGVELDLDADAYRPHLQIPNLFLPRGLVLEPPLRRDKVRELFAPDPDALVWVRGAAGSTDLEVTHIEERAFRPLDEWVEWVVDRDAAVLRAWVEGASFDFSDYIVEEVPFAMEPSRRGGGGRVRRERAEPSRRGFVPEAVAIEDAPAPKSEAPQSKKESAALAQRLATLERELAAQPGDAPVSLWTETAELNARLGRAADAALCWARALWAEEDPERAAPIARAWATSEAQGRTLEDLLDIEVPTRDDARAVAALVTRAALEPEAGASVDAMRAGLWLDKHDALLDPRALWLARAALSRLAGHDVLALARARDAILARLHRGVSLERDVPTFLRLMGGARDAAQLARLAARVEALAERFQKTKRPSAIVEASPKLTLAYVLMACAWGLARLGQAERARAHVERGVKLVNTSDPIHAFLMRAFAARVTQALEGLPPETPLPAEVRAGLDRLARLDRYKVDRVRQASQILEPQQRLDPILAFQTGEPDARGPEFEALRGRADVQGVAEVLARIIALGEQAKPDERARLLGGAMDFFPLLPPDDAARHLRVIIAASEPIAPSRRVLVLETALMLAGYAGDPDLAREAFAPLSALVRALDAEGVADAARAIGAALRTLRRAGLHDEAASLLEAMRASSEGAGVPARIARVHAGAALAHLGRFEEARPAFQEALAVLDGEVTVPERLELTRALARAVGAAPEDYALAALDRAADGLRAVTDSFNTNSHLCVSALSFLESLVFGYASDDLGMGERSRQWLEDDEYLIRRRVHRDMSRT